MQPRQRVDDSRQVKAHDVIEDRIDLDAYPGRYLLITPGMVMGRHIFPALFAAVERLEATGGWELISFPATESVFAVVRRTHPPAAWS